MTDDTRDLDTSKNGPDDVARATGAVRATDADRTRTADWLAWAAGTGQLTLDEADERLARAYAARTLDELAPLTTDLQPRPQPAAPPAQHPGLRDRLHGLELAGSPHAVIPVAILALFLILPILTHGAMWFPWPLIVVGMIAGKAHHRHHHAPGPRRCRNH
ncbi:DUF1707 SHOCT-like domain-containing protein [Candidatus Frankia alpina]|uniref:DUF1707 SHOCT-like domain-containing protein n=1 Tax=Candidatus Frankia alpina TaxID=2699483 RepID=UPI0013D8B0B8|nr:DUF1707 domain-containing protein [Candidatus Frankia alpina]